MNAQVEYARLLIQQSRFDQAETEIRRALGGDPNDAHATALLALCLSAQKKYQEATDAARSAVALAPNQAFSHYILASVFDDRDRFDEAETAIREAIRLDPLDSDFFALLAGLHAQRMKWSDALREAEHGLALDAQHVGCTNLRAMALTRLGRKSEADAAIASALAREPENALTHTNRGWTLLQSGQHRPALEHFREALRLQPEMEWARLGVVEAMKARHLVYRLMLRFFLFMGGLSSRAQWGVIIGAYVGCKLLTVTARTMPEYEPFLLPVIILYLVFVLLTWIARPMYNLVLRLDKFGRHALSREETRATNLFGLCILAALLSVTLVSPLLGRTPGLIGGALFGITVLPVSATYKCASGWPRKLMAVYTAAIFSAGLGSWLIQLSHLASSFNAADGDDFEIGTGLGIFFIGSVFSTWIALGLSSVRIRK